MLVKDVSFTWFTMVIQYNVHLGADSFVALAAVKVNTGENRPWFFDEENNLIGLFKWDNYSGLHPRGICKGPGHHG